MHSFYLRSCYLENQLARGVMEIAGERLEHRSGRSGSVLPGRRAGPHRAVAQLLHGRPAADRQGPVRAVEFRATSPASSTRRTPSRGMGERVRASCPENPDDWLAGATMNPGPPGGRTGRPGSTPAPASRSQAAPDGQSRSTRPLGRRAGDLRPRHLSVAPSALASNACSHITASKAVRHSVRGPSCPNTAFPRRSSPAVPRASAPPSRTARHRGPDGQRAGHQRPRAKDAAEKIPPRPAAFGFACNVADRPQVHAASTRPPRRWAAWTPTSATPASPGTRCSTS